MTEKDILGLQAGVATEHVGEIRSSQAWWKFRPPDIADFHDWNHWPFRPRGADQYVSGFSGLENATL
jgi:hypothetical protein